jgi:predicted SAM-dependent methyltransferase
MRNFIAVFKLLLPSKARFILRQFQKSIAYKLRRQQIKIPITLRIPVKVILGAAMTHQVGWYSTNQQWLDIRSIRDWKQVFQGKVLITNALAEHVFEHLTKEETQQALKLLRSHMLPGARIRIAVPDGYNPDLTYIRHVGVAGIGADAGDHKQLLNADKLCCYLKEAGFEAEMLEGYLSNGELVQKFIDPSLGMVIRSRSNSKTMEGMAGWDFKDANTSLIVDGIVPL